MRQDLPHQLMRYGLVGGIVYVCDFAAFAAMLWCFPAAYLGANILGKGIGAVVGFVLHRHFTFSWEQRHGAGQQAFSYLLLLLSNIAISTALLWMLVDIAGINEFVAKLCVDIFVIGSSFIASRLWVYRAA